MNQILMDLVRLDDELNIRPDIATHWEISEDAKTISFICVMMSIFIRLKSLEIKKRGCHCQ